VKETALRRAKLAQHLPALEVVTDAARLRGRSLTVVLRAAIDGGANLIQLRDANRQPGSVDLAEDAHHLIEGARLRALIFVNDGCGTPPSIHADGLHLPEGVAWRGGRAGRDAQMLFSRSVHSVEAAVQAERDGADMLVLGTVFPSASHPGGPTIGLDAVRAVCAVVSIPVIGIGGITVENAADVIRAGASGIAVISAVFGAPDPRAAALELRAAIDEAWAERG
jgi:thiamine-phosphate pyrophosphorylase